MPFVYLQYTGGRKSYYTPESFIREAKFIGFGRVVPRPLPFNSLIAFAQWQPYKEKTQPKLGDAVVFAIGKVTGWHVQPKNLRARKFWFHFVEEIKRMGIAGENGNSSRLVRRQCGEYIVSNGMSVDYSFVEDLLKMLKSEMKKWNEAVNPEDKVKWSDFRWIVTGHLVWYANGIEMAAVVLHDLPFTRGYLIVELPVEIRDYKEPDYELGFVVNYRRKEELLSNETIALA